MLTAVFDKQTTKLVCSVYGDQVPTNFKNAPEEYEIVAFEENEFDPAYDYSFVNGQLVKGEMHTVAEEILLEYAATEYQRRRKEVYPDIREQLDMLYWDKVNGTDNWTQTIQAIKEKYPKNNS